MSTAAAGGNNFGGGLDADTGGVSSTVAGATTFFVLVVSGICMWLGADAQRVLLTASLSMMLFALISYGPAVGVPAALIYLAMVGGIKRYAIPLLGYSSYDPLLLVSPLVVGLFFTNRLISRDIPRDTPLAKMILGLLIIFLLEIANPFQGGIAIGLAGGLYYVVPLLWFYIGREVGTPEVRQSVFKAVIGIALLGSLYGLYQQFFGFTDIEKQWLAVTHNDNGLSLGGSVMRVFSFFSSFSEYAHFTALGTVVAASFLAKRNRLYVVPLLMLFVAVVLCSSRGTLLSSVGVCALIWAVQGRTLVSWAPRLVLAALFGIASLFYGLSSVKTANISDTTTQTILSHQARGLLAPLDKKQSTGSTHLAEIVVGVQNGFRNPLGSGLGATTLAAGKFGAEVQGTEFDISNIFAGCGFVGGFLYLAVIFQTLRRALWYWLEKRDVVDLATLAVLAGSWGLWLMSGHYPATMLVWFVIGGMDRSDAVALQEKKRAHAATKASVLPRTGGLLRNVGAGLGPAVAQDNR